MKKTILATLLPVFFAGFSLAENSYYGVIEIGAKGIKPMVIEKNNPKAALEPKEFNIANKEPYKADTSKDIAEQVGKEINSMREQIRKKFGSDTQIFVVQSSGVPESVRTVLQDNLPPDIHPDQMDVEREAIYVFDGIVPSNRRNLGEVVVLDIGSGNTKGAYLTDSRPPYTFETFSRPFGTGTFSKKVAELRTEGQELQTVAEMLAREEIQIPLEAMMKEKKGMRECTRLYLAGGLPYVMTTLLHPEQIGSKDPDDKTNKKPSDWVRLEAGDIETFCKRALTRPEDLTKVDFSKVKPENRANAEEEVRKASGIFKPDELLAGAVLLKTFMGAMEFDKKGAIFFSREALYAWPQGYVKTKLRKSN